MGDIQITEDLKDVDLEINCEVDLSSLIELKGILADIKTQIEKIAGVSVFDSIGGFADGLQILTTVIPIIGNFLGINNSLKKQIEEIASIMSKENGKIRDAAIKIGEYLSVGLVDGMESKISDIRKVAKKLIDEGVVEESKEAAEINSPSKVMKRIGGYIAEGLGDGIKDGSKDVERAMKSVTDTVEDSAKKTSKVKFGFGGIAAVAGIVASLVGYFANMMSTNEELSGKMQETLSTTYTKPRVLDI